MFIMSGSMNCFPSDNRFAATNRRRHPFSVSTLLKEAKTKVLNDAVFRLFFISVQYLVEYIFSGLAKTLLDSNG